MAVLTWRNVDAPNLNGRTEGTAIAARLFGNATSNLSDALGGFGKFQSQQADNAATLAALQYQDPTQLQSALSSGSLLSGIDASKLDPSAISSLGSRVNDLLNQQTTQQNLAKTKYEFGQQQEFDAASKAAQPVLNQVAALHAQGKTVDANALLNAPDNQQLFAALKPAQLSSALQGDLTLNGTNTGNADAALRLNIAQRTDTDNQAGLAAAAHIAQSGTDPVGAELALQNMHLSPGAYSAARARLDAGGYVNPNTPVNAPLNAAAGGGAAPVLGLTLGGGQLDPKYQTVGDVVKNATTMATEMKGHTNVGPFQITAPTFAQFAPAALGADWEKANVRDFATQDKVGGAIWDSVKDDPSAMQGRWTSLSPATAAALKGKSWDQARTVIAQGESSTPQSMLAQLQQTQVSNAVTQSNLGTRGQQNVSNLGFDPKAFAAAAGDGRGPAEVANELVNAKSGVFAGQNAGVVQDMIQQAIDESSKQATDANGESTGNVLNAARAALLVQNSLNSGGHGFLGTIGNHVGSWFGNTLEGGQSVNSEGLQSRVSKALQGLSAGADGAATELDQASQSVAGAAQMQQNALSTIQTMKQRSAAGLPVDTTALARAQAQYALAKSIVDSAANRATGARTQPLGQSEQRARVAQAKVVAARVQAALAASTNEIPDSTLPIAY